MSIMKPAIPLHFRVLAVIIIAVLFATYLWIQHFLSDEYANLAALNAHQKIEGFVPVGRFGESWPASVVEILEADDRIEFERSNGQPHIYQGFEGFRLRMIRLKSRSGSEVIVVYRSELLDKPPNKERNDKPVIRRI